VRFGTDSDLYLLFISPYDQLNLWLPADITAKDRLKAVGIVDGRRILSWRRLDGTIKHYREVRDCADGPTGSTLAIDLTHDKYEAELEFRMANASGGSIESETISGTRPGRAAVPAGSLVKRNTR